MATVSVKGLNVLTGLVGLLTWSGPTMISCWPL